MVDVNTNSAIHDDGADDNSVPGTRFCKQETANVSTRIVDDPIIDGAVHWILSLVSESLVCFDPSLHSVEGVIGR